MIIFFDMITTNYTDLFADSLPANRRAKIMSTPVDNRSYDYFFRTGYAKREITKILIVLCSLSHL